MKTLAVILFLLAGCNTQGDENKAYDNFTHLLGIAEQLNGEPVCFGAASQTHPEVNGSYCLYKVKK